MRPLGQQAAIYTPLSSQNKVFTKNKYLQYK